LKIPRTGLGTDKRKNRRAIRRGDGDPPVTGVKAVINDQPKSKLVHVESQTLILIANEHGNVLQTQVGVRSIHAKSGFVKPTRCGRGAHRRDYKSYANRDGAAASLRTREISRKYRVVP
jgi:hypothetical protein